MKTKIIKIKFSKEQQKEIDLINKNQTVPTVRTVINKKTGVKQDIVTNRRFTYGMGRKRLFELYGGVCSSCGQWPSFKIMHDVGDDKQGAWQVYRYCSSCYDKVKDIL